MGMTNKHIEQTVWSIKQYNFIVVLICTLVKTNDVEHLSMYLFAIVCLIWYSWCSNRVSIFRVNLFLLLLDAVYLFCHYLVRQNWTDNN